MTDKEKAEESFDKIKLIEDVSPRFNYIKGYLGGLAKGRKNCMTVQNAMETIKRYCKEITDENNNCSKCIFCSKGFNGCKLQRAPCEWEMEE